MRNLYSVFLFCYFLTLSTIGHGQDKKDIIKNYLLVNFASLNLSATDANQFTITSYGTLKNSDYLIAYLQQEVGGVKIANTAATVLLKNNVVTSFKHTFVKNIYGNISSSNASLTAAQSARKAISELGLSNTAGVSVVNYATKSDLKPSELETSNFEAPLNYFKNSTGTFVLSYEIIVKDPASHWWQTKINASNGTLLEKSDLMISCNFDIPVVTDEKPVNQRSHKNHSHSYEKDNLFFNFKKDSKNVIVLDSKSNVALSATDGSKYNAFPLGVETPNHGSRTMINNPARIGTQKAGSAVPSPEGWHEFGGKIESKTVGNNVQSYEDGGKINGPATEDSFAAPSSIGTLSFDYPLDLGKAPIAYQKAAIVNLFVWNNYMHDVSYAYGFDETNGNFQEGDYDRFAGPTSATINDWDGDEVQAEAQDGSGLNNANFGTLIDGFEPTMQMFLWGASPFGEFLDVIPPSATELRKSYASVRFPFVAIPREGDPSIDSRLVLVEDDGTPWVSTNSTPPGTPAQSPDPRDGCTAYTAAGAVAVKGKIAVIIRGNCPFVDKITIAQDNGAIGVIIINNAPNAGPVNGGGVPYKTITIPTVGLSFEDGKILLDKMATEPVFGRLVDRGPLANLINRDGDLDQGIIAHEYGHGISTRLVGGRNRFDCLLSQAYEEQMGEGWSDFFGLIMTQKINDTPEQKRGIGTYVQFQGIEGPGIRPSPYSTDMSINDYTYADIANPAISVPHGVGFVWSTMIWDMYWAFIGKYGFDPDIYYGTGGNNMAIQLVMDGLKLITCGNVGFVEGRNSIIQADAVLYGGANECLIRAVFARRGVGALAQQGTSERRNDQVEDFTVNVPLIGVCGNLTLLDNTEILFSIYPNPMSSELFIRSNKNAGKAVVSIFDMNGRQLIESKMDLGFQSRVDTGNLVQGVYIVTIKLEDGTSYSQKLIKK
ncbi:T9SS type A sorting domain-containing protein [Flavobacterium sp. LS1P28]|uniref:T9SS-dependent M36 family metallopeptidase n=1 Tax=Flavobacterium sp. LS1P28 TaxID=2497752 RepID=UPI000F82EC10|nr:T9SS-dependent M36 family metallopeptidase [Flavobacterium sp. LS1P28]RTY80575.1 T9SS type A sorting domain-containing protein [Flavobacterium sp. LS1P28]